MARKTQCDETCEGCPVPDKVCDRFYDCPRTAAKAIAPYIKVVKKPVKQQAKVATCPMQTTTCEWGVLDIRCTAKRVFNRFCELRGALGSGITQQTKPAITPPTSGGKEYGTGG